MRIYRCSVVAVLALLLPGCNGGGGGSPTAPSARHQHQPLRHRADGGSSLAAPPVDEQLRSDKRAAIDRDTRYRVFDALSLHREAAQWRERAARDRLAGCRAAPLPQTAGRDSIDIGEIAVVQDDGDLIAPPNSYDLRGRRAFDSPATERGDTTSGASPRRSERRSGGS